MIFDQRHTAIFASAVNQALRNGLYSKKKMQKLMKVLGGKGESNEGLTPMAEIFSRLGLMKQQNGNLLTSANLQSMIQSLKSSTDFSDFDPKFVYYIAQIYFKFMVKSKAQIYYIDYKDVADFGIERISSKSKIGIIGDFGTGLNDSIELLSNMVLNHGVDVILHLGDVYYAGTPHEYLVGVTEPLKKLRLQTKR